MSAYDITADQVAQISQSKQPSHLLAAQFGLSVALIEKIRKPSAYAKVALYRGKRINRPAVPRKGAEWHTHQTKGS